MNNDEDKGHIGQISRRNLFAIGLQGLGVYALGKRAYNLQVEESETYVTIAENNRITTLLTPAPRGIIYDIDGRRIAENVPNFQIFYTKSGDEENQEIVQKLGQLLGLNDAQKSEMIENIYANDDPPIIIAEHLSYAQFAAITENLPSLPGCQTSIALARLYPYHMLFAHEVGYIGAVSPYNLEQMEDPHPIYREKGAFIGKTGVELLYEETLRGGEGRKLMERRPSGQIVRELEKFNPIPGQDVQLTLSAEFQNYGMARLGEESAAAVIIDVETGEIKLMISGPSFDPNSFVFGISQSDYDELQFHPRHPMLNKAVSGQYPPGSTFKPVTALAGLEAGTITQGSAVTCTGKITRGRDFHCHSVHGYVNLRQSLKKSCDIFYYIHAEKTGIEQIAEMAKRLGLGQKYDLPLNYMRSGLLGNTAWLKETYDQEWLPGDTMIAGIGQGYIEATPLQLAVMTARIASGKEVIPTLTRKIGAQTQPASFKDLGIKPEHLKYVRDGMWAVANEQGGTALGSRIAGEYEWGGKTGTSQTRTISKSERERGVLSNSVLEWEKRDHALFIAFAPFDKPKYAVSVIVEHGGGGSKVAAPIARDLMLYALNNGTPPLSDYPASARGAAEHFFSTVPKLEDIIYNDPRRQEPKSTPETASPPERA